MPSDGNVASASFIPVGEIVARLARANARVKLYGWISAQINEGVRNRRHDLQTPDIGGNPKVNLFSVRRSRQTVASAAGENPNVNGAAGGPVIVNPPGLHRGGTVVRNAVTGQYM